MDEELAALLREFRSPSDNETRMFYEVVIAPGYTPEGLAKLKGKSKTLRILEAKPRAPEGQSLRQIAGGPYLLWLSPCLFRSTRSSSIAFLFVCCQLPLTLRPFLPNAFAPHMA